MSVPTNLIPTKVTGLPEYTGSGTYGYMPYVIDGRTYKVQFSNIAAVGAVPSSRTIATGTGLTGGGDLSQDRTISIAPEGVSFDQLAPSGVVAGVYGSGTAIPVVTVDAKGRVTSATTTPLSISGYVPTSRSVFAGTGLTGGGDLASDVTLAVNFSDNNPQALGTATAGVSTAAARGDHVHPAVDLSDTSQTQGALPLGRGGTGDALSPVAGAVVYSTGTKFALTNPGIAGQVLMSNGVDEPLWATVTGIGTVTSVNASGGTTGLTFTGGPVTTAGTLTLGGTLAVTNGGTGATNAATARSNLGAAASGANSDITSMSGITGAIATPDYIDFDTAATVTRATGRLWWDNADGNQTLSLGMAGGNATLQIGEEMYFRIKASSAITEGQAVMFTGTLGASGGLTGAPATGLTKDTASYLMGVATEDIPLNSWGYVTQFGLVRSFNTTGGAEAWVDGQILYYNPAVPGGLTKTVPTAPAAKIEVAAVVHAASNGSVFVRPTARFSLTQLNDVETSAASDLDLLQYNGTSGVWQHKSPSLISVGSATNLAGGAANRIAYQTGAGATGFVVAPTVANTYLEWSGSAFQWSANPLGTVTSVNASGGTTGLTFSGGPVTTAGTLTLGGTLGVANGGTGATSLTSGYLLKGNGTSAVSASVVYDDGTNVGIGTASPGYKLDVAGQSRVYNTPASFAQLQSLTQYTGSAAPVGLGQGSDATGYLINLANAGMAFGTNGSEHMRIDATGNVGIGATSITGIFGRTLQIANGSTEGSLSIVGSTGSGFVATSGSVFAVTARGGMALTLGTNDTEKVRITSAGYVGVGVTPSASTEPLLQMQNGGMIATAGPYAHFMANAFYGSGGWTYTTTGTASRYEQAIGTHKWYVAASGTAGNPITFTQAMALDGAGNVALTKLAFNIDSPFYTGGNITAGANALGIGTTGAAQVGFFTNNSERMRITSAGFVGIGTSSPSSKLTVLDGDIEVNATGLGNTLLSFNGTTANLTVNSSSAPLVFGTNSTERMRITSAGTVGIGTNNPIAKLEVNGGIRASVGSGGVLELYEADATRANVFIAGANASGAFIDASYATGGSGALLLRTVGSERMRIDASGNVGIGTTNPIYPLMVSNGGAAGLEFSPTAVASAPVIQSYNRSGAAYTQLTYSALRHVFWNSGTERMRIESDGTVQVGGTGETQKLNVITNTGTSGMENSFGISNQVDSNCFIRVSGSANGDKKTTIGPSTGTSLVFNTADTERMRIDASGLVGIGMNSQAIRGTLDVSLGNIATAGVERSIHFGYSAADYYGFRLVNINSPSSFAAGTFSIQRGTTAAWESAVFINNGGAVGIGTSSPITTLHVTGASGTSSGSLSLSPTSSGGGASYILMGNNDSAGVAGPTVIASANRTLQFGVGNSFSSGSGGTLTEYMRIQSDGNVGIGTSNPLGKLSVVGQGTTQVGFNAGLTGSPERGNIWYDTDNSGWKLNIGKLVGSTFTAQMTFQDNGNVGIGTSSPGAKLAVDTVGTSGVGLIVQASSLTASQINMGIGVITAGYPFIGTNTSTNPLQFGVRDATDVIFVTGATEKMRLTSGGNVGIGTTAPASKLHVSGSYITAGSVSSTGGSKILAGEYSNAEHITTFGSDYSSGGPVLGYGVWPSTSASGAFVSSAAINIQRSAYLISGQTHIWYNGAAQNIAVGSAVTVTERMRLDASGNFGVGRVSPDARLSVDSGSLDVVATFNSTGNTYIQLQRSGSGHLYLQATAGAAYLWNQQSTPFLFGTSNTERMRIGTDGEVAIATSSAIYTAANRGNLTIGGSASSLLFLGTGGTTGTYLAHFQSSNSVELWNGANGHMAFATNNTERFRILAGGGITSSDLADAVGYKGLPQNSQTTGYTLALSDMGKHISITTGNITIPANGSVAFPVGAAVTIFNNSGSTQTISITTDTLRQAGTTNTGTRTLAAYGVATVLKVASTTWVISGNVT